MEAAPHKGFAQDGSKYAIALLGFTPQEHLLADAAIKLSTRRTPSLVKVASHDVAHADVLLIDGTTSLYDHIQTAPWFHTKVIIRVDSDPTVFAHYHLKRPVEWHNLQYIITLALEKFNIHKQAPDSLNHTMPMPVVPTTASAEVKRVLIVDDSQMVCNHLTSLAAKRDILAVPAHSVGMAMKLFQEKEFDCVLMDVLMPDINGYEGCKLIKKINTGKKLVPVIMLTSKSSPFDKIKGKMAGCDAYLTKPTTEKELFFTIAKLTNMGVVNI